MLGITFGRVCVAGETMGLIAVGSKPFSKKRCEKSTSAESSGYRSLILFSSFEI